MRLATYDLKTQPTTFDFVNWLVNAKTHGCDEIQFVNYASIQTKKYPEKIAQQRFQDIVLPSCKLAGIETAWLHLDDNGDGERFSYFWKDGPKNPWKFPYYRKWDHTTVTIRDYNRNPHRNSNRKAWERFCQESGAILIDDNEKAPIPLATRWDLYQCKMNYFVDNGPAILCYYSDAPYASFKWQMTTHLENQGFHDGYQFPWANANQRLIWKEDTYDNIKDFARSVGEARQTSEGCVSAVLAGP